MSLLFALVFIYIIFGIIATIATIAIDPQDFPKAFDDKSPIELSIVILIVVMIWPIMLLDFQKDWSKQRSRLKKSNDEKKP